MQPKNALHMPPQLSTSRPELFRQVFLSRFGELLEQGRAAATQRLEVLRLVIGRAILPAAVKDSDPLKCERSYGGLMRRTLSTLLPIIGAGPGGLVDGLCGPVNESLAKELRALPAPMHPFRLTAAFGDWRDTGAPL